MKMLSRIFVAALLFLSSPQARAAGPGGVERVGTLDLGINLTPVNPLSILYLQRAQLLREQMEMTVEFKAEQRALDNEIDFINKLRETSYHKSALPREEVLSALKKSAVNDAPLDVHQTYSAKGRALAISIDKRHDALEQLKEMIQSINEEIKTLTKAACSCSENPKAPGGAAASGPCSCS